MLFQMSWDKFQRIKTFQRVRNKEPTIQRNECHSHTESTMTK